MEALRSAQDYGYFKHAATVIKTRTVLQIINRAKNIKLKDLTKLTPIEASIKESLKILEGWKGGSRFDYD